MTPRKALWILIAGSTIVRVCCAGLLGLGNDEAYHFLYAVHPDLSYYDHPPMLAWVELVGLSLSGSLFSPLGLRIGFVAMFAASTWLMGRIAGRWYGAWSGFYAALALNLTGYYGLAASTFALPDGPLLFFWLLTIDRLDVALERPAKVLPWFWVGLAWGGAMLSKYHAIFLPVGTILYLSLYRPRKDWLLKPGPYLAVGLGLLVFSPVIVWNASHGWVSFLFQGGRAIGGFLPRPDYLAMALLAQVAYFFPWIWGPLVLILFRQARDWKRLESDHERLGLCLAIVPLGMFTLIACFRPVLPHWGLIGLVVLFPVLGRDWSASSRQRPRQTTRWLSASAAFSLIVLSLAIVEYRTGILQRGGSAWGLLDHRTDPTADLYGWDQVAKEFERLGILDEQKTYFFTRNWYLSAQLSHAIGMRRPVLCYNGDDPRGFAFWSKPEQWVGHDGILVIVNDDLTSVAFYRRWFQDEVPLADFWVERGGKPVRHIRAHRLVDQVVAYPFDFSPESVRAGERIRAGNPVHESTTRAVRGDAPEESRRR